MAKIYVGLDVGSSSCHLVAVNKDGEILVDRKFTTGEQSLLAAIESLKGQVYVHLEASELAGWIRRVLRPHVVGVIVGHAKSSAWIAKDPLKRDQLDAYKLAMLLRMGQVHEVFYADEDERTIFKQIVQHYDDVTEQEVRIKLKIKSRLRAQGIIVRGDSAYSEEGRAEYLPKIASAAARASIEQLYQLLDHTLRAQSQARSLMRRESKKYPEIGLFEEVPGIGLVGASRFSAYVQTPFRFGSKRKLWRYCRLGITDRRSDGKPLGRQALDWNGNPRLKAFSRFAFIGAMKSQEDNAFRRAYQRSLEATHNRDHARLSTQRKILTVLWTMWRKNEKYQDEKG